MNSNNLLAVLVALSCGSGLSGCSEDAQAARGPVSDPCALVADSEVRTSIAGASAGQRNHSLDQYGIATCSWESPVNTLVVQIFAAKGSAADEARSRVAGFVDPLKPKAGASIQYVAMAGLGDAATAAVAKANPADGILGDTAVLAIRRGDRMAVLFASSLIGDDRSKTLEALAQLGRAAAARL